MAKRPKKERPTELTKKQRAKSAKARRRERITIFGISIIVVLVVGVLAFGSIQEYLIKPNSPIATVDGVSISTRLYQKLWKYQQANLASAYQQYQAEVDRLNALPEKSDTDTMLLQYYSQYVQQLRDQLMNLDLNVLNILIDDELVRQQAKNEGIVVTPEEVQTEIETSFGYERNPPEPEPTVTATAPITTTPEPTPTRMSEEQFNSAYQQQLDSMKSQFGFTEQEFRAMFENEILKRKLQEVLAERVPTTDEQVHARHILVETEEEANAVLERLKAGEDFAALAAKLSLDESNKEEGGDLGWFPRGAMVPEFEAAAFSLEPGTLSDPVQTDYGYHIIEVLERDANHPLDEATLSQRQSSALTDWLATQRYTERVKRYWSSDKVPSGSSVAVTP